jgi:hypothetical protein
MDGLSAVLQVLLVIGFGMTVTSLVYRLVQLLFGIPTEEIKGGLYGRPDWTGMTLGRQMLVPGLCVFLGAGLCLLTLSLVGLI